MAIVRIFRTLYLLQLLLNDQCLTGTTLSYKKIEENDVTEEQFTEAEVEITVDLDSEYTLAIHQRFTDGHKQLVWTELYKIIAGKCAAEDTKLLYNAVLLY